MKVRQGFVSNSSSSSFCVYGFKMGHDKFYEILKDKYSKKERVRGCAHEIVGEPRFCPDCGKTVWVEEVEEIDYCELLEDQEVLDHRSEQGDSQFVGAPPWAQHMDETRSDFEKRIEAEVEELMGCTVDCGWINASIYG